MTITVNEDHILISLEHTIMYQINNVVFSKIHNDLNLVVPKDWFYIKNKHLNFLCLIYNDTL